MAAICARFVHVVPLSDEPWRDPRAKRCHVGTGRRTVPVVTTTQDLPPRWEDVIYEVVLGSVALITINRPERMNAFRGRTVDELIRAFKTAWADRDVAAVVLTGAGDRAFCAGGDVKERAETGGYGETEWGTFEIERLHRIIRDIPKPVIAAVNGIAIGGGHVLHVLCDLSIAATHARFGQTGPRVGSFDAGFGSAYLARVIGEKRARQMWFLLDQIDAETALSWGLVNLVVPGDRLITTALSWGRRITSYSPTALRFLKHSFNADSAHLAGLSHVAFDGLEVFSHSEEAAEGARAFAEKRDPDFGRFR
jgi:dihydroxynaphthoic acid synthetase